MLYKIEQDDAMHEENLYTPEEISRKLKISKYTVYEMIKQGELEAHRIGRGLRITDSQFETYLIRTKRGKNNFSATIIACDEEKFARVSGENNQTVDFSVSTELEGDVRIAIKPEEVIISKEKLICSARNNLLGKICWFNENNEKIEMLLDIGVPLTVSITKKSADEMDLEVGQSVYAVFKSMSVAVIK